MRFVRRNRASYWSSSSLSKYLKKRAGIETPFALSLDDWRKWRENFKNTAPVTYFITESLLNRLQRYVCIPGDLLHSVSVYWSNAIKNKIHYLKTGLPVGTFYDTDLRMLCANMNALVDFIEIEWAWLHTWTDEGKVYLKDFRRYGRSWEAGIKYIETTLNDEYEIPDWYNPERLHDVEYVEACREQHLKDKEVVRELFVIYSWWKCYFSDVIMGDDEQDQELEDKYLKRLIELRHFLWT